MISYIVGNPGSGKTYYAVYKIYEYFIKESKDEKESKPDLLYCYTNINQFKFETDERLLKFEYDKFYSDMEILYALYLDKVSDEELNEKAKELKLHKAMFVFDECHNFLKSKKDPILVWWLTYHRHLYQEIFLITQDLSLVNPEYKRVAEQFFKAVDASKIFLKNKFKYVLYGSYRLFKKDIMNTIGIPYSQEVFNLYHSGNKSSNKSFVRKFFFISFVAFIAVLIYSYYFIQFLNPDEETTKQPIKPVTISTQPQTKSYTSQPKQPDEPLQTLHYYNLTCIDEICRFKDEKYTFPYAYISYTLISSRPKYFYSNTKNKHFIEYFLVFDKPVLDEIKNLKKGVSNESVNQTSITSNFFK